MTEGTAPVPPPEVPSEAASLKALELEWKDHHHMRDQTWKLLASNLALLLGVVGLAAQKAHAVVLLAACAILFASSVLGWAVSTHHRLRQRQKFEMIVIYERRLGLYPVIQSVLDDPKYTTGIASKLFTGNFLGLLQLAVAALAALLGYARLAGA